MLENIKREIIEIARKADELGYCKKNSGNFSVIDREKGVFVISPTGKDRFTLVEEDIMVLDLEGNILEGNLKPSSEWPIHLKAYLTRPDITSVIHTHSHYATAFAILGKEIPPIIFEALNYGGYTMVAPYAMPGSDALAQSIVEPLQSVDAVLMKSHGVLVVGDTLKNTLLKASYVEDVAEIYSICLQNSQGVEPDVIAKQEFIDYVETMKKK